MTTSDGGSQSRFANLVVAAGLPLNSQIPADQHAHDAFAELKSFFPTLVGSPEHRGAKRNLAPSMGSLRN
ncbi:MAG TPA: hypothetical protein VFR84_12055 [Candidatus Angelobacter sp.]|nr:hypothetical protein [Candidatus Angelobacter sp.]